MHRIAASLALPLIERYAQAEGIALKDVMNLAYHQFFERRQHLPELEP